MTASPPTAAEIAMIERAFDEHTWIALGGARRWCRTHALVFEATGVYSLAPGIEAHGICPDCTRAPKRPLTIVIQDWWRPTSFGQPPRMMLQCEDHAQMFENDEMCRVCASDEGAYDE